MNESQYFDPYKRKMQKINKYIGTTSGLVWLTKPHLVTGGIKSVISILVII